MKRETAPRFAGIGGHHSHRAGTVEWLTPPSLIRVLGPFKTDPCVPLVQPYPTAEITYNRRDNGLVRPWIGRVWLNPPYTASVVGRWLARMADHNHGTALIFARTDTEAFHRFVFGAAAALLFMEGRINFHRLDGRRAARNAGAPTVLVAYGLEDADVLAGSGISGQFVALRIPRSIMGALLEAADGDNPTWRELVEEWARDRDGAFRLDDLYRFVRSHPKAAGNRHVEAKARQTLQRGNFRNLEPGLWEVQK